MSEKGTTWPTVLGGQICRLCSLDPTFGGQLGPHQPFAAADRRSQLALPIAIGHH
jgi:hypothetical protein